MGTYFLTGGTGFIGSNIKKYLEGAGHTVFAPTRSEVDWLNMDTFWEWEQSREIKDIDAIIHCAGVGGRRLKGDNVHTLYTNIAIIQNVYNLVDYLWPNAKFFFIGSGAEHDRRKNITNAIWPTTTPTDFYGLSKCAIQNHFSGRRGVCNLRAFGVFGPNEEQQRFVRTAIHAYKYKLPLNIHKDRRMDFFYVEDIARIVEAMTEHYPNDQIHDINLSYKERLLWLSDIAMFINTLDDHESKIVVESSTLDLDYFGNSVMLKTLQKNIPEFELVGQKEGLKRLYNENISYSSNVKK